MAREIYLKKYVHLKEKGLNKIYQVNINQKKDIGATLLAAWKQTARQKHYQY